MVDHMLSWLLTYLVHSTLLLGFAWLLDRTGLLRRLQIVEGVWRVALFGAFVTATLQAPTRHWIEHRETGEVTAQSTSQSSPQPPRPAAADASPAPRSSMGFPVPPAPPTPPSVPLPPLPPSLASTSHADLSIVAQVLRQPGDALLSQALIVPMAEAAPFIVIPWLLLALFGCLRIVLSVRRLNAETRACPVSENADASEFVAALAARHGRSAPLVRMTGHRDSPYVAPGGDICVPSWVLDHLDKPQREAVLAHEVAHIVRRDPLWRIVTRIAAMVGMLQPLNRVALRRLEGYAELACDEWSARASGHRRALAEALFECAQRLHLHKASPLAPAAADCSSSLLPRIDTLMKAESLRVPLPLRFAFLAAFIGCISAAALLPGFTITGNAHHVVWRDNPNGLHIIIDGDVVFTDDESDVRSVTRAAVFEQTVNGKQFRMAFEPDAAGGVKRIYAVDGRNHAFDAEGRAWLAGVIQKTLRETAWHPKERIEHLRAAGGNARVFEEIGHIDNDFARSVYIETFVALGPLDTASVTRLLETAGAAHSDFDRTRMYQAISQHQTLDAQQLAMILSNLDSMQSDFDKRNVLDVLGTRLAALAPHDPHLAATYVGVLRHMQSAFDRSRALIDLVHTIPLDRDGYALVLSAAEGMNADFETCELLVAVAQVMPKDAELISHYHKIARLLGDFERGRAERALDRFDA